MSNKNVFQDPRSIDNPVIYVGKSDSSDSECGASTSPMCPLDPDICTVFPDSWRLQILWVFFYYRRSFAFTWVTSGKTVCQTVRAAQEASFISSLFPVSAFRPYISSALLFVFPQVFPEVNCNYWQRKPSEMSSLPLFRPMDITTKKTSRPALQHLHTKYSGRHNDSPTTYLSCIYRWHWFDT